MFSFIKHYGLFIKNDKKKPNFAQNMTFFFKYQLNFMYFRYFMWNFAGRQSDVQGNGEVTNGNWLSGINFIDEMVLHIAYAVKDYDGYFLFLNKKGIAYLNFSGESKKFK